MPAISSAPDDEDEVKTEQTRSKTCRRPTTTARRSFTVTLDKLPETTRPLEAQVTVRLAESGGRAVERKLTLPVVPSADDDRRQAAVLRPLARRGRDRELRRGRGRARRQDARRARPALRTAARSRRAISGTAATAAGSTSRSRRTKPHRRRPHRCRRRQAGPHLAAGAVGPLSARSLEPTIRNGPRHLDRRSTPACTPRPAPTRPTCWRSRSTSRSTRRATP